MRGLVGRAGDCNEQADRVDLECFGKQLRCDVCDGLGQQDRGIGEHAIDQQRDRVAADIGAEIFAAVGLCHVGVTRGDLSAAGGEERRVDQVVEHHHAVAAQDRDRRSYRGAPVGAGREGYAIVAAHLFPLPEPRAALMAWRRFAAGAVR